MKKIFLALFMVLAMTLPAMAQVTIDGPSTSGSFSPIGGANAQAGATASVINANANTNTNVNTNTQIGVNTQGQIQGQGQSQNNGQVISPSQNINIEARTPLMGVPSHAVPELNFGQGKMKDVTRDLPNFSLYGIKPLGSEPIRQVVDVTANVKFKRLYRKILFTAKDIVANGANTKEIRYQVIKAEAQKSWSTGGNLGGGSSVLSSTGLVGGAGSAGLIPQWGGTKADDLFTIIFVRVVW
jgi:hypothetical protein